MKMKHIFTFVAVVFMATNVFSQLSGTEIYKFINGNNLGQATTQEIADFVAANSGSGYYQSADNFATFTPATPAPSTGDFIWDERRGALYRKTGASTYSPVTIGNGTLARERNYVAGAAMPAWDADLYNLAYLDVPSGTNAVTIALPNNLPTNAGETFRVVVRNGDAATTTITWATKYMTFKGSDLGSTTIAGNATEYYDFKNNIQGDGSGALEAMDDWGKEAEKTVLTQSGTADGSYTWGLGTTKQIWTSTGETNGLISLDASGNDVWFGANSNATANNQRVFKWHDGGLNVGSFTTAQLGNEPQFTYLFGNGHTTHATAQRLFIGGGANHSAPQSGNLDAYFLGGFQNTYNSGGSYGGFIGGDNNTISNSSVANSIINSRSSTISVGGSNTIVGCGTCNIGTGANNGRSIIMGGQLNDVNSQDAHVSGVDNTSTAWGHTIFGLYNVDLTTIAANGSFSATQNNNEADPLFQIGGGLSSTQRKSPFVMTKNGWTAHNTNQKLGQTETEAKPAAALHLIADNDATAGDHTDLSGAVLARMTTTERNNMPAANRTASHTINSVTYTGGVLIYNTTLQNYQSWNNTTSRWDNLGGQEVWAATQTVSFTVSGDYHRATYPIDCSGGNVTVTFPASPFNGDIMSFTRENAAGNTITFNGNGININGVATDATDLTAQYASISFKYNSTINEWRKF